MTIKTLALAALAWLPLSGGAQSLFPHWQTLILGNNPDLLSETRATAAANYDELTGLTLADPEVNVSYMFGAPADVPNKTNIEVTQTFDFPTMSGARRRVAQAQGRVQDASLLARRSQLALEVEKALIEYVYASHLAAELEEWEALSSRMLAEADTALEAGTITILEHNGINLQTLAARDELDASRVELASALATLHRLNGGKPLENLPQEWPDASLPPSLEEWTEQAMRVNPELELAGAALALAAREVELRKKQGLPEFSVGYVNELVKGGNYHGASIGFSLPLWGNKGRVKGAEAVRQAAEESLQNARESFALKAQSDWERASMLRQVWERYDHAWAEASALTERRLSTALQKKTISIADWLRARTTLKEYALRRLQAAREWQLARAELYAPTL